MSLHPLPEPGPPTIAVEQRFPSLPLGPGLLSREHSKQSSVLGRELFEESSRPGWLSANPQPRLFFSKNQTFPLTKAAGRSESSDSSLRERSSNNCIVLRLSSLTICPLQPLHRNADSIASSNVTRTFKHSLHMKKLWPFSNSNRVRNVSRAFFFRLRTNASNWSGWSFQ